MRLAIIGCGAIGSTIARAVDREIIPARLVALHDIVEEKCRELAESLGAQKPLVARSLEELLEARPQVVVEAASQEAVKTLGPRILEAGAHLVVLSVGALLDPEARDRLLEAAQRGSTEIHVPSGAIAGLDALKALRLVGIERLTLRTRKPPRALGVETEEPKLLFKGPASEAVKRFPANINVAAALTLAAGVEPVVEIVADPAVERNTHEILVESPASRLRIVVENTPSPDNPKTSYLASLSAISLLRSLATSSGLRVGS